MRALLAVAAVILGTLALFGVMHHAARVDSATAAFMVGFALLWLSVAVGTAVRSWR